MDLDSSERLEARKDSYLRHTIEEIAGTLNEDISTGYYDVPAPDYEGNTPDKIWEEGFDAALNEVYLRHIMLESPTAACSRVMNPDVFATSVRNFVDNHEEDFHYLAQEMEEPEEDILLKALDTGLQLLLNLLPNN